ncbi:MAG: radical SAM protein [Opitutaceae bacterium]|nr:radical SAM protein [Opitutaceae bacterium]
METPDIKNAPRANGPAPEKAGRAADENAVAPTARRTPAQDSCPAVSFLPATAVLEITRACNHRCVFCSCPWEAARLNGFESRAELSVDDWKAAIDMLCARGVGNIAFSGGEALLRKGIFEIIKHAAARTVTHIETRDGRLVRENRPPALFLISNGTVVTRETLLFLREHGVRLSMSLPGLATLPALTGIGDPDVILDKFRMARELGMRTVVNVTVTKQNLPELYQTISAAFLAGARQLLLNRFLPGGRGLFHRELLLDARDIRQMLDTAEAALADAGLFGSVGTELPKCLVDASRHKRLTVGTRCSAALDFFVIGPDGFARVCNHSTVKLLPFREMDALPAHPYWRRFTLKDYLPPACMACPQMGDCDGGCREAARICGGAPDSPDPLLAGPC